jgi:hypothetical protein
VDAEIHFLCFRRLLSQYKAYMPTPNTHICAEVHFLCFRCLLSQYKAYMPTNIHVCSVIFFKSFCSITFCLAFFSHVLFYGLFFSNFFLFFARFIFSVS